MRVTLIHNAGAGDGNQPDADQLRELIRRSGHEVEYRSCDDDNWAAALKQSADLVAVAGGDGTIGRVAKRLVGRGIPLAVLPMGTANNISRTLGVIDIPHDEQIAAWHAARRLAFDIGVAKGPWGTKYFVEALGVGLFAWTMPAADASTVLANLDDADAKVAYALKMLEDRLEHCPSVRLKATLDGTDLSGDYALFETMLMQYVGPNLYLAPESRLADGLLDVVLVTDAERNKLSQYLSSWKNDKQHRPNLPAFRGRRLQMEWTGFHVHIDDEVWPEQQSGAPPGPGNIDVTIQRNALEFVCPAAESNAMKSGAVDATLR